MAAAAAPVHPGPPPALPDGDEPPGTARGGGCGCQPSCLASGLINTTGCHSGCSQPWGHTRGWRYPLQPTMMVMAEPLQPSNMLCSPWGQQGGLYAMAKLPLAQGHRFGGGSGMAAARQRTWARAGSSAGCCPCLLPRNHSPEAPHSLPICVRRRSPPINAGYDSPLMTVVEQDGSAHRRGIIVWLSLLPILLSLALWSPVNHAASSSPLPQHTQAPHGSAHMDCIMQGLSCHAGAHRKVCPRSVLTPPSTCVRAAARDVHIHV